jgi:hypothetical protein
MGHQLTTTFSNAIESLRERLPDSFAFGVPDHYFRDVGSMERALEIQRTMRSFEARAAALGYTVTRKMDRELVWWYDLKKQPKDKSE